MRKRKQTKKQKKIENLVWVGNIRWQNSSSSKSELSLYRISRQRNVGTRYLEISWWDVRSSKSSYPHRWRPTRRGTWRWTRGVLSAKTYAERSNRRLALPVQRVKRTRFFLKGTLNIRTQIRLASKDPRKEQPTTLAVPCYYLVDVPFLRPR